MSQWFECKVKYDRMMENGVMKTVSEPYLVDALSFTEAEARITDKMKVAHWTLGTEANATLPWTVTTANGSLTITGTVSTSGTTLVLDLNEFYPATTV